MSHLYAAAAFCLGFKIARLLPQLGMSGRCLILGHDVKKPIISGKNWDAMVGVSYSGECRRGCGIVDILEAEQEGV